MPRSSSGTWAQQMSTFPPFCNVDRAEDVYYFTSFQCGAFINISQQLFEEKATWGLLFCSTVEDAHKCSITAPTRQLWWHVMATFPNSLSHKKRSASDHSDRHNDRLPFYVMCNLPRKWRLKLPSTFVTHRMRGVCTKPIKGRIASCCFFPGALCWKFTSIY